MAAKQNLQPTTVIAEITGYDVRRIQQFNKAGIIKGVGRSPVMYDLLPTIQALFRYQKEIIQGKRNRDIDVIELEEQKLAAEVAIKEAKAEQARMQLKELQGSLHRSEDVEAVFTDHGMYMRSMLLAMPGKLAVDLAGNHTAAEQAEVVKREVHWILNNLADYRYDPEEYKKRVMEREGWNDHREGEDDGE